MSECILGRKPGGAGKGACFPEECRRCGFDREVAKARICRIRAGELTENKYGVRRLVLDPETGR